MSLINPLSRELSAKIVYYGPGLSGKTTSLKYVHTSVRPERRGELVTLETEGDRTLFFDFLPIQLDRVQGMPLRLHLYTVPGQVFYAATRKLVLNGADGVVFVADSQPAARDANRQSLEDLQENLDELGIDLASFPHVFQYNKRDLPNVLPVHVLNGDLNRHGRPAAEASAHTGTGVLTALREAARLVIHDLNARRPSIRPPALIEGSLVEGEDGIAEHLSAFAEHSRQDAPAAAPAPRSLSFVSLWEGGATAVVLDVEELLVKRQWGAAARAAAGALAELLRWLPGPTASDGPMAKALILGIDGREYMRVCRLASAPDAAVTEADALFAFYVLIGARVKSMAF